MPETTHHRGPDPEDAQLFAPEAWPALRAATGDLCWLLSRDYALPSATELVGNHFSLSRRQRMAIARCACPATAREQRRQRQIEPPQLRGQELWLDGFKRGGPLCAPIDKPA